MRRLTPRALVCGSRLARGAALADLAVLVFAGLSRLQVAAVGHVTALAVGAVAGGALMWRRHGWSRALLRRPQPWRVAQPAARGVPAGLPARQRPDSSSGE